MRARANYKTCWWSHSKQCDLIKCERCMFYVPTLKGMMEDTDFVQHRRWMISEGLSKLLSKDIKDSPQKHIDITGPAHCMDDSSRKILVEELIKAKALKFRGARRVKW